MIEQKQTTYLKQMHQLAPQWKRKSPNTMFKAMCYRKKPFTETHTHIYVYIYLISIPRIGYNTMRQSS